MMSHHFWDWMLLMSIQMLMAYDESSLACCHQVGGGPPCCGQMLLLVLLELHDWSCCWLCCLVSNCCDQSLLV
jgi:hypothetical protein